MSVSSVSGSSSLSDPSAYLYPSDTTTSAASSSSASSSGISSYQSEYNTLMQYDTAEMMQVSFASPSAAASNVDSVLAQAASLQDQQLASQQQAAAAAAQADVQSTSTSSGSTSSSANDPMNVPTLSDITSASDETANAAIDAMVNGSDPSALIAGGSSTVSTSTGGSSTGTSSTTAGTSSDPMSVPTLGSVTSQSDADASTAIQNYLNAPPGSSFDTFA